MKIISSVLLLAVLYMGFKQGWSMIAGKPEMVTMFGKWAYGPGFVKTFGAITLLSALLIVFPQTYNWGNFVMASSILFIMVMQVAVKDLKGALIETPFLLMNIVLVYLQHPLSRQA